MKKGKYCGPILFAEEFPTVSLVVNPCEDLEPPALPCFWASAGLQTGSHLASVNDSNRIK